MRKITSAEWEKLASVFSERDNIIAAWVFGSAQDGTLQSSSDLDLAVLFDGAPELDELLVLRADLQLAVQIDDIDLVSLSDTSSPILRFEAISGRSIFCRDAVKRATFASLTAREYEDEMAFLRRGLMAKTS